MYPFIWISIKHTGKGRDTTSEISSGTRLFRSSQTTLLHLLITMSRFTILVLWPNNTHRSRFYSSTVRVLSEYFNLFVLTGFIRSKVRVLKAGYISHCSELISPHLSLRIPRRWEIPSKPKHMRSYYSEDMDTRMSSSWFSSCLPKLLPIFCFLRCVFYGDLYPNKECYNENTARNIALLIEARKKFAYGPTTDYFVRRIALVLSVKVMQHTRDAPLSWVTKKMRKSNQVWNSCLRDLYVHHRSDCPFPFVLV